MRKILSAVSLAILLLLTSCSKDEVIEYIEPTEGDFYETRDRYDNKFDDTKIPNQWEGYGIGDPYVLRYNGEYYLYASTKNLQVGVMAWKSSDLINWEQVDNGTLKTGYVTEDEITIGAYAPEVIYWDGMFYMYTSPEGKGHYILTSDSPEGPFTVVSDNIGEGIDGSVFIDDDESMYFLRAFNTGIRMIDMADPLTLESGTTLDNTVMGGWSEGPTLIKRDGIYYLTYTGTHVTSPGYRVNYSTAKEIGLRSSFNYGDNNSLLLSTDEEWKGLGHNSMVLGPNLDSYYIVYHNLNNAAGPNRSFNINRLLFNGTMMSVNGTNLTNNIAPELPEFSSSDGIINYEENGNMKLSNTLANAETTIEYNFIGENSKLIFGYQDSENYHYITADGNEIKLMSTVSGNETEIASGTLVNNFDFSKLHTVRVISDGSDVSILFDNLTKINRAKLKVNDGKIGYENVTEMRYSSFSNNAFGSSDKKEPKNDIIGSNSYLNDESSKVSLSSIGNNKTYSTNNPVGSNEITMKSDGGYASYTIDVEETGLYALFMNLNPIYSGSRLFVQIDKGEPYYIEIPEMNKEFDYVKQMVTEIDIPSGVHQIKFITTDTDFGFNYFKLEKASHSFPEFTNTLEKYIESGVEYKTLWKLNSNGHHAIAGNRQLVYFGNDSIRDCTIEVDMTFIGETASSTAGIILRGSNEALSSHENYDSILGYYIGFNNNRAFINKYNYNLSDYTVAVDTNTRPESGVTFTVRVEMRGNAITVYVNEEEIMNFYDSDVIESGRIGFYTEGAEVIYTKLTISK